MKEDVIRQVKEAESRAEEKTHEAQAQADKIIRDARHQAVELRHQDQRHQEHGAEKGAEQEIGGFALIFLLSFECELDLRIEL